MSHESTIDREARRKRVDVEVGYGEIMAELARLHTRLDGPSRGQRDLADSVKDESADEKLRDAGFVLAWGEYTMPIPGSPYIAHIKQFGPKGWQWLVTGGQTVEDGRVNLLDVDIAISDVQRFMDFRR